MTLLGGKKLTADWCPGAPPRRARPNASANVEWYGAGQFGACPHTNTEID